MNKYGLDFHHLGLAVTYPGKAAEFLKGIGYSIGKPILDKHQNVFVILCTHNSMPTVELIYRGHGPGPLDNILKEFQEVVYHLCYACSDLEFSLSKIKSENRVITVSGPKPSILFSGKMVSFYRVAGVGLIEIVAE